MLKSFWSEPKGSDCVSEVGWNVYESWGARESDVEISRGGAYRSEKLNSAERRDLEAHLRFLPNGLLDDESRSGVCGGRWRRGRCVRWHAR